MFTSAVLALLSVAVLLLVSLAAAQSPPQSYADVRITSITGCVDVYPVTVNCSVASNTLRIQTAAGFPSITDLWLRRRIVFVFGLVDGYNYFDISGLRADPTDPTNTSVFVDVAAKSYFPHITGVLVNVSFIDQSTVPSQTSPAFAGFSFRFEGPPTLTAIAGCEGSGQATLNCVPDATVLELMGSGLLWYSTAYDVRLRIGNETSWTVVVGSLAVVNDSYATLSLTRIFSTVLKPQQYAGVLLPLSLTSYGYNRTGALVYSYTTNAVHISFVPLPPPQIRGWSMSGCNETRSDTRRQYTGCLPTYDLSASVGGVQCSSVRTVGDTGLFSGLLPSFDYDPSVAYDLVISNDAGSVTYPGAVQFTSAPTLISIDQCIDRGDAYSELNLGVRCPVGTTLTLRGSRFPAAEAVSVQYLIGYRPPYTTILAIVDLLVATVLNGTTITATLPALDNTTAAAYQYYEGSLQIAFTSDNRNTTTNKLSTRLYVLPNTPSVTSISSDTCKTVSALQLANCRALAVITVVGSNLAQRGLVLAASIGSLDLGNNYLFTELGLWDDTWYDSLSNTSLVFTLAYFDADTNVQLQPDVVYTLVLKSYLTSDSNAFRLSLTYDDVVPASLPSSSSSTAAASTAATSSIASATSTAAAASKVSSSSLSSGAIAGIVIAAVVAAGLLALLVVRLLRRTSGSASWWSKPASDGMQRSMRGGGGGGGDSSSEAYTDVELH